MAGISHLADIYRKKGKDFIDKLFDNYVTVNEKLDGSAFSLERSLVTKEMEFYKRNNANPISLVDRTLARYYEKPISYFTSLDESVSSKLPLGWRFGFEYFVSEGPQELFYDRMPKNGLVLSYIHVRNGAGKIVRTIQDKKELDKWADLLGVERSPILFQGVLNDDQKVRILEFIDTPKDDLYTKFKTDSFVKFVVSVLNPGLKKTLLNENLEKPIEGIVFRFGSSEGDVTLAKMVDPVFEEIAKTKTADKTGESNDIYHITLMELANFIESRNFNKYKPKGRTYEDRYLNFVCSVFNDFVSDHGDSYEDMDFNEPAYMKKPEFDLNSDFISNPETLSHIDRAEGLKKLFKIILASFRKKKRRPNGVFDENVVKQFNMTVDRINNHLTQNLKESEIPLFGEFLNIRGRNAELEDDVVIDEPEDDEIDIELKPLKDEPPVAFEVDQFKQTMDSLSGDGDTEDGEGIEKKNKKRGKRVNMIVGRFQPFHNGHLEMARELYNANKLPVVIVAVHPGHNNSGNSPFTIPTLRTILENIKKDGNGVICDFRIIGRGFIGDVIDALRPQYEPVLWGVGPDRYNDYLKQLELNFIRKNELQLDEKFEVMETKRYMSGTDVRQAISDDHFGKFKTMVPKSVQSIYPLLRNDLLKGK